MVGRFKPPGSAPRTFRTLAFFHCITVAKTAALNSPDALSELKEMTACLTAPNGERSFLSVEGKESTAGPVLTIVSRLRGREVRDLLEYHILGMTSRYGPEEDVGLDIVSEPIT